MFDGPRLAQRGSERKQFTVHLTNRHHREISLSLRLEGERSVVVRDPYEIVHIRAGQMADAEIAWPRSLDQPAKVALFCLVKNGVQRGGDFKVLRQDVAVLAILPQDVVTLKLAKRVNVGRAHI